MFYLDLIDKVIMPKIIQTEKDITRYKKQQQQCLENQKYIQQRIKQEIELYKQRIKENKNVKSC